jgi:hypothetical protein
MTLVQTAPKKIYLWVEAQPITTAWIYHNSDLWLISLSSDWTNWITIADKNLWATTVYNSWDTLSEANCGKYYQRWNNYWFSWSWTVTNTVSQINTSSYWPSNYYSSSTYRSSPDRNDRSNPSNDDLWWDTTNTLVARQWPCGTGFHIPTLSDLASIISIWTTLSLWTSSTWGNNMCNYLKIPLAWNRWNYWTVNNQGTRAFLWTSSKYTNNKNAYQLVIYGDTIPYYPNFGACTGASSIRPFANSPIQPDEWWTRLDA